MLIELPSGLVGEARRIRGTEAIELAEIAATPRVKVNSLGKVLRGCWLQTTVPGPYSHAKAGEMSVDWDRVLKGDLLYGLIHLRAVSVENGLQYDFPVQCERCRARYEWRINDITKDFPVRRLSADSAEHLAAGRPFKTTCADADGVKHELTYDLMFPSQDEVLRSLLKSLDRKRSTEVESLAAQTRTIDGEIRPPGTRQKFFANLDLGELSRVRDVYDESDVGMDVDVLTTCQEADCGWEQETTVPFGRTFWKPETNPKKTKTASPE